MWCEQAEIRWARCGLFEVAAWPFQSLKSSALTRMWRWCQVQSSQKERTETRRGCCCNFADGVALKVWFSHAQYMKMTRDEHVLGFKSCDISICWWIWMLSFLLKLIWIGIDFLLLKFFATFGSVSGLPITVTFGSVLGPQVTVELQVNSWLQSPTRLGAICCRHNAPSSRVNQRKSRTNNTQPHSSWDQTFDQVRSSIAATISTLYVP